MARFHTLYNAIELRGPTEYGLPDPKQSQPRLTGHSKLFGRIGGAAGLDRRHDLELVQAQVPGLSGPVRRARGTKDVGDLD